MLSYTVNGVKQYPQNAPSRDGTYNFTKAQFYVSITENVSDSSTVSFGLQESTGIVYFSRFLHPLKQLSSISIFSQSRTIYSRNFAP